MTLACPNCQSGIFAPQDLRVDLKETLDRWEAETKTRFRPETRAEYEGVKKSVFHKCGACRFGAFIPAAAGTANFYNDITVEGTYYVAEKWEFRKTFDLMRRYDTRSLLDYGSGTGAFLKQAALLFPDCAFYGYDQNPQAAAAFQNTKIGFLTEIDRPQNKPYDMITAFQILEHLEDPFSALRTLKGQLRDGGILIVSVPNTEGPIRHFPTALTEIPPHHVNRFNAPSLRVYLERAGFNIETLLFEPLSEALWDSYLPVMVNEALPRPLGDIYRKFKGPGLTRRLAKYLGKIGIRTLPFKGHSVYIVGRSETN